MVKLAFVLCTEDLKINGSKFEKGKIYIHKKSSRRRWHCVMDSSRRWVSIVGSPRLRAGWEHTIYKLHFKEVQRMYLKNNKALECVVALELGLIPRGDNQQ